MPDNIWAAANWIFRKLGRINYFIANCCYYYCTDIVLSFIPFLLLLSLPVPSRFLYLFLFLIWIQRLVKNLMACISNPKQQHKAAVNILENFAAENKYYWYANTSVALPSPYEIINSISGRENIYFQICIIQNTTQQTYYRRIHHTHVYLH